MPEKLVWKQEYSVGVPLLDQQHQGLIELINLLSEEKVKAGLMGQVFEELEAYTKDHFSAEEKMLKASDYRALKAHKKEHREFEQWLSAVRQTYSVGVASPTILAETVNAFLRDWLINHILSSDMAYKQTLCATAGKGNEANCE